MTPNKSFNVEVVFVCSAAITVKLEIMSDKAVKNLFRYEPVLLLINVLSPLRIV